MRESQALQQAKLFNLLILSGDKALTSHGQGSPLLLDDDSDEDYIYDVDSTLSDSWD